MVFFKHLRQMSELTPETSLKNSFYSLSFLESGDYFITEKARFLRSGGECSLYNNESLEIGSVVTTSSAWHKLLQLFLKQYLFPFTFTITDHHQKKIASIHREWFFFKSNITINDPDGELIGFIQPKYKFPNCRFKIFDSERRKIAEINGDWKGLDFTIIDKEHILIGKINRQSPEPSTEISKANMYHVNLQENAMEAASKLLIISTALTLHLILNESRPPLKGAASK